MNSNTMSIDKIDFDVGNFLNPLHKHKHLKWRVEIGQGEEPVVEQRQQMHFGR